MGGFRRSGSRLHHSLITARHRAIAYAGPPKEKNLGEAGMIQRLNLMVLVVLLGCAAAVVASAFL